MVTISSYGYNVMNVFIPTALTVNQKTKIGTTADFIVLLAGVRAAGIIRVQCTLGTVYMDGAMIASPYQGNDGIEAFTISAAGEGSGVSPYIVHAAITLESGDMYVTPSIISLS